MKKIKDFSKVIGVIGRAGYFYPSNESSEAKARQVYQEIFKSNPDQIIWKKTDLINFTNWAKVAQFEVIVMERGINR